jgi:hypothetical protein
VAASLAAAGCVSMPTGGPVASYPVTQGPGAQNQPYVQIVPNPPGANWSPTEIVQGFLTASASFGSDVALQYLTPQERKTWNPLWSAIVYKDGPNVTGAQTAATGAKGRVTVQISGKEQAYLQGYGSYSVPLASAPSLSPEAEQTFQLVQVNKQWRISSAPQQLLLTSDSFNSDYQLRYLYFLDPAGRYLVPDPVYVPVRATSADLMNGLVNDLISPPSDWLSGGATTTALPRGTKISSVGPDGVTAVVNLTGAAIAKASTATMERVSAQLLWTLTFNAQGSSGGQSVQSVEVEVNGKPWTPAGQGNPVQRPSQAALSAPPGASTSFYYVDSAGYLTRRAGVTGPPSRIRHIGTGFTQLAVSPDGRYLAALRGSTLYTGLVASGPLDRRGSGYLSVSWDRDDDLWASAGTQIVMFRNGGGSRALAQQLAVEVNSAGVRNLTIPFGQLRVAPDGVRVALVDGEGDSVLTFGAISGQHGASPQIMLSQVELTPPGDTAFSGLSWYGPTNVITLAGPGPVVTEFPVSGGGSTSIPVDAGMQSVTASAGSVLVAGLPRGHLASLASLSGSWLPLADGGSSPAYPG